MITRERERRKLIPVVALAGVLLSCAVIAACSRENLPEELGWYAVDSGSLKPLARSEKLVSAGSIGHVVYGIKPEGLSSVVVHDPDAFFIVYALDAPNVVEPIHLSRLGFTGTREVEDPNLPPIFQRRGPVRFNAYTAARTIQLGVVPIAKDQRMFKLVPKEPLTEGVYALHRGDMEGAPFDRFDLYDFVVGAPAPIHDIEGTWVAFEFGVPEWRVGGSGSIESILCEFGVDRNYSCSNVVKDYPQASREDSGLYQTEGDKIHLFPGGKEGAPSFIAWLDHYSFEDNALVLRDAKRFVKFRKVYR